MEQKHKREQMDGVGEQKTSPAATGLVWSMGRWGVVPLKGGSAGGGSAWGGPTEGRVRRGGPPDVGPRSGSPGVAHRGFPRWVPAGSVRYLRRRVRPNARAAMPTTASAIIGRKLVGSPVLGVLVLVAPVERTVLLVGLFSWGVPGL